MRNIMVLLLVIGFLVGTFVLVEELTEENLSSESLEFLNNEEFDRFGDPAPCSGDEGRGTGVLLVDIRLLLSHEEVKVVYLQDFYKL